jgi:sugar O-acyltransferase (sialic acid O-acetyltransferase NeuD family)
VKVLIIGAGGHGQVVADILQAQRTAGERVVVVGYVDDDDMLQQKQRLGIVVLGRIAAIPEIDHDALIVALGDNGRRAKLHERTSKRGVRFAIARHPSAIVASGATVGEGSMICARAVVGCESRVGRGVILNTACTVDHHASIGDFVHIAPGVHLGGEVSVGDEALVGLGAVVLPGLRIGSRAVVGAGAVVTRNVPAGATVTGVPANLISMRATG